MNSEQEKKNMRVHAELVSALIVTIIVAEIGCVVGDNSKIAERRLESANRQKQLVDAICDLKQAPLN